MPLEPLASGDHGFIVGLDLNPADLWCGGPRYRPAVRGGEQLAAETDPEHRYVINMRIMQHGELWQHPGPDGFMIIYGPRGAHGDDHVEVRGLWELALDIG
jgi:hypothetical protein